MKLLQVLQLFLSLFDNVFDADLCLHADATGCLTAGTWHTYGRLGALGVELGYAGGNFSKDRLLVDHLVADGHSLTTFTVD